MKKMRNFLLACCLGTSILFSGCETHEKTGTLIGAGLTIGGAVDKDAEGAIIGGLVGAGAGNIIGSNLDREKQTRINREYNKLMRIRNRNEIRKRIDYFADREFGNNDGWASLKEKKKAYRNLDKVMRTISDVNGNYNGFAESWEIRNYQSINKNNSLIRVL